MKITEKEFNVLTSETIITECEETAQEQSKRETFEAEAIKLQAEAQAKATARQAVLDRLGLTAEEAQLLLGGN
jgi:predicted nucleic acid-binding protein